MTFENSYANEDKIKLECQLGSKWDLGCSSWPKYMIKLLREKKTNKQNSNNVIYLFLFFLSGKQRHLVTVSMPIIKRNDM